MFLASTSSYGSNIFKNSSILLLQTCIVLLPNLSHDHIHCIEVGTSHHSAIAMHWSHSGLPLLPLVALVALVQLVPLVPLVALVPLMACHSWHSIMNWSQAQLGSRLAAKYVLSGFGSAIACGTLRPMCVRPVFQLKLFTGLQKIIQICHLWLFSVQPIFSYASSSTLYPCE